jgi:hypothetical protein
LATFRARFPSRNEIFLAFVICVFPVYVWSIINLLMEVPAWILRLNTWDLIGVIAYTQAFALIESVLVLGLLVLIGAILPARMFRNKFVAFTAFLVFITTAWFIFAHLFDDAIRLWGIKQFIIWIFAYLVTIVIGYGIVLRFERIEKALNTIAQRLSILSIFYIIIGVLSLFIVIFRNIA